MVTAKWFDIFIMSSIVLNTFVMMLESNAMNDDWVMAIAVLNMIFTVIFTVEVRALQPLTPITLNPQSLP